MNQPILEQPDAPLPHPVLAQNDALYRKPIDESTSGMAATLPDSDSAGASVRTATSLASVDVLKYGCNVIADTCAGDDQTR